MVVVTEFCGNSPRVPSSLRRRFRPQQNPIKNIIAASRKTPISIPAFAIVLIPEDDALADPAADREVELLLLMLFTSALTGVVGFVIAKLELVGLPVFGTPYTVSIFCYM